MRNLIRRLHLWVSVPFGLVITITCFTGAMLVFEKEITALCTANISSVQVKDAPLPLETIASMVSAQLPDTVTVTGIVVSDNPSDAYKVNLSKPRRAALYVDQYTGEIKGRAERLPFFDVMFKMHRWLMDSSPKDGGIFWGKVIVGASTIAFVAILITGLVVWWPRTRKALKNRIKIVASKGGNRFLYDLHVAGGFYALILLLAMALTGLTWSFEWYRNGFYNLFGVPVAKTVSNAKTGAGKRNESSPRFMHWQEVFDVVAATRPDYNQITISDGTVTVSAGCLGNRRASDKYIFDKKSGKITDVQLYKDTSSSTKIRGWIYSVHVGSWGGVATRVLAFLAAMLGATLPLTGYYLWIKRLYRKRSRKQ